MQMAVMRADRARVNPLRNQKPNKRVLPTGYSPRVESVIIIPVFMVANAVSDGVDCKVLILILGGAY